MRIITSTFATLLLLVGSGLAVHGQATAPPGAPPEGPPPRSPDGPRPVRTPDGRQPDGRQPAPPQGADIEEVLKDYDTNGDGYLTREELPPSLRPRFDQIDTDRNGRLSRRELEQGILHLHPQSRPSDFIYAMVEMSAVHPQSRAEVQRVYDVLRRMDKNGDGKIDEDELRASQRQIIKDRIDFLFKDLDLNSDGRISRAEARGQLRQDFNVLDTNRDGFIDRDELMRAATARPPADQTRPGAQPGTERVPPPADRGTLPRPGTRPLPEPPSAPAPVPGRPPVRRVPPNDPVPPPPG